MAQQKEKLEKFLQFIEEISVQPGNEWFRTTLQNKFNAGTVDIKRNSIGDFFSISENVKYVALAEVPVIDYSGIKSKPVENQLIKDCVEMGRFKLGKIENTDENFGEFCRYAHLQAEEMINYFFLMKFSKNLKNIVRFITNQYTKYDPKYPPKALEHIPYLTKLMAYKKGFKLDVPVYFELYFLNEIRNELSHRNSLTVKNDDSVIIDFAKKGWSTYLNASEIDKLNPVEKELYNRAKFIITKRAKDYSAYYVTIELFKQSIILNLSDSVAIGYKENESALGSTNPELNLLKKKFDAESK